MQTNPYKPLPAVFLDVYAWLKAVEKFKTIPMEGVFRHADRWARICTPCYFLLPHEAPIEPAARMLLENYLGKNITCYTSEEMMLRDGLKVWLSPALDFVSPVIMRNKAPFIRVAILHDILAHQGHFGLGKPAQFEAGAAFNDVLAYVSVTTLHDFNAVARDHASRIAFIPYGCFHHLNEYPDVTGWRQGDMALSVHSLYRRKNFHIANAIVRQLMNYDHVHVGRNFEMDESELVSFSLKHGVRFLGPISDSALEDAYRYAGAFICMSHSEGFSMPPMEAMLYGVREIILSDIPIHREVYGRYSVTFLPPVMPRPEDAKFLRYVIPEEQRKDIFSRYSFENVARHLYDYLEANSRV